MAEDEHFKNEPESEAWYSWLDGGGVEQIKAAGYKFFFCGGGLSVALMILLFNFALPPRFFSGRELLFLQLCLVAIIGIVYGAAGIVFYFRVAKLEDQGKALVRNCAEARLRGCKR